MRARHDASRTRPRGRLLAAAILALAAAGCSDAFDPTAETDLSYVLDGTLDGLTDRQVLRVQDLMAPLDDVASVPAPTVTSTELVSGRVTAWRDSLVGLEDGGTDRVALADLEVGAGETHRIEVEGQTGRSVVTVALPAPTATVLSVGSMPAFEVEVRLDELGGRTSSAQVRYRVRRTDGTAEADVIAPVSVPRGAPVVSAFLSTARGQAAQILYGPDGGDVVLLDVRFEVTIRSERAARVEGGLGEVDWIVPVSLEIPVPSQAVTLAGFLDGR